jgi:hypothetical protein
METTIYSLPRDVMSALMITPFCELRHTCKQFRELCADIFVKKRSSDESRDIIYSAAYSYTIPRTQLRDIYLWDGSVMQMVTSLEDIYHPLCNYILIPRGTWLECNFILCADNELRHFARMMNCIVYKLYMVAIGRRCIHSHMLDDPQWKLPTNVFGDVLMISRDEQSQLSIWRRSYVNYVDRVNMIPAIRGASPSRICVYVMVE